MYDVNFHISVWGKLFHFYFSRFWRSCSPLVGGELFQFFGDEHGDLRGLSALRHTIWTTKRSDAHHYGSGNSGYRINNIGWHEQCHTVHSSLHLQLFPILFFSFHSLLSPLTKCYQFPELCRLQVTNRNSAYSLPNIDTCVVKARISLSVRTFPFAS